MTEPVLNNNQWWMTFVTLGESWHNNHHAFPGSAHAGLRAGSMDVAYGLIRLWAALGLASQLNVPTPERIAAKRSGGGRSANGGTP